MLRDERGVPLAEEKTVGPSTAKPFLRIELDFIKFETRFPQGKLSKAKQSVKLLISICAAMKRKLLSLIGHLHHCCKVIVPARPLLRSLIHLSTTVKDLTVMLIYQKRLNVT